MNDNNAVAAKCGNKNCKCEDCECSQEDSCDCKEGSNEWR